MRIVNVVLGYYPGQIWGGIPPVVAALSKGLKKRGQNVSILSSNILDRKEFIQPASIWGEWEGIPVLYVKSHWKGYRPDSFGFIWSTDFWRFRHVIREADIIHIHNYRTFFFVFSALLAMHYKVPYIVQPHGGLPSRLGRVWLKSIFDRTIGSFILKRAAKNIALSRSEVQDFHRYGVTEERIIQIHNPFDPSVCPDLPDRDVFRTKLHLKHDDKIVLFLSRLHVKKGLDLLIEACAQLDRSDIKLCVVGPDAGFESRARHMVEELGMQDRVIFVGPLYGHQKFEAYRAADIYVLPTRGVEGLPVTLIEALYANTPIITTNTTDVAEIIADKAGLVVDADVNQLKNAIAFLFEHPELQAKFREGGRSLLAEYFDLDIAVEILENVYETCTVSKPKT